jgi:hypothetical protein
LHIIYDSPVMDEDERDRLLLAQSPKLTVLLDPAEQRMQTSGGYRTRNSGIAQVQAGRNPSVV